MERAGNLSTLHLKLVSIKPCLHELPIPGVNIISREENHQGNFILYMCVYMAISMSFCVTDSFNIF
jgi:hypothetical protein